MATDPNPRRYLPGALVVVLALGMWASLGARPKAARNAPARPKAKAAAKRREPPAKKPQGPLPNLGKGVWIWASKQAATEGAISCYFRKAFDLPQKPVSASVLITADNGYDLYVNGSLVGGDTGYDSAYWKSVERYDVAHLLVQGRNAVAIRGINLGGPAGLVAAMRVDFKAGPPHELFTDRTWRMAVDSQTGWSSSDFDGAQWRPAVELAPLGKGIWGAVTYPGPVSPGREGAGPIRGLVEPPDDFRWPGGVVFLTGRVPESSTGGAQSVWRIAGSRAYLELDTPGPSVLGRRLHVLQPAGPEAQPRLLVDAAGGVIGSPSVSYDGRHVYFAMAPQGEKFYHVYRVAAEGGQPAQLTRGPFHDFDPEELPDGRIVFSSTRIGSREEYHGNTARSLFVMGPDGADIHPITHHIVGDNEPRVTADGLIAFIRCDNFLERAKVETQIHQVRPDGTAGQVLLGADRGPIGYDRPTAAEHDSRWLRSYGFGSIAPLPDGRVACLSSYGLVISSPGTDPPVRVPVGMRLFDISAMPDGRLLCTLPARGGLGVLDPATGEVVRLAARDTYDMHSVVYLGPRPRPPAVRSAVFPQEAHRLDKTGYLVCQNVFRTKQTHADLSRVRAIRVYEGAPFFNRSARHQYDHIGVEAVELGTVPLAPDGSFYAEVPADRALALQAVDAEGRSVVSEMSWIYVRPGEWRSCVGCHSPRQDTPGNFRGVLAAGRPPVRLLGQGRSFAPRGRPGGGNGFDGPHRFRGNNAANGGVLNLQLDRFREAAAINLYRVGPRDAASGSAIGPGRAAEVRAAVAILAAGDEGVKISALQKLAILRDRSAAEALAAALGDASRMVRMNAALALSACGDRRAAGPLLKALADPQPVVAQAAAMALENLTGHAEPSAAYAPSQARKRWVQAWRAWLAASPWEAIEKGLIERLSAGEPAERHRAIVALGHIGGEAARAALRDFLVKDKGADLRASMEAMRALGTLRDAQAVDPLAGILNANIQSPRKRQRGFHEVGFWQAPAHRAGAAAEALGRIATPPAEAALIAAYGRLENFWHYTYQTGDHSWLMGCHSSVPHHRIAEALDAIGSKGAGVAKIVPAMLQSVPIDTDRALLYENDACERITARVVHRSGLADRVVQTCLAVLGSSKALPDKSLWPAVTASPPASSCRPLCAEARAAQILSVVCCDARYASQVRVALDSYRATPPSRKRSWTCFFLARTLGKLGGAGAVDSLIAALDKDATEASFGRPDPPNVFLHNAMTPCYRAACADALGRIGAKRAVPALLHAVGNFDNAMDVRHAAARALAMIADPSALGELRTLAQTYPEVATRRMLRQACANAAAAVAGK